MSQQLVGQQCQSCGMPLSNTEVHGTDSSGNAVQDYCIYCYENGKFNQPDFTVDEMIAFCAPFLVEQGMDEQAARGILAGSLPELKRWTSGTDRPPEPDFTLVRLDEIKLVGIAARTSNKQEMSERAKIGGLWERFWREGIQQSIPNLAQAGRQHPIYGCYADYENGAAGEYTILIGCKVTEIDSIPAGMEAKVIPASQYAVFRTRKGPISSVVIETWQSIWKWSASSELQRTFTGDFEIYDERSADPSNAEVDIYIAVK